MSRQLSATWPLRAAKIWNGVRCTREAVLLGSRIVVTQNPPLSGAPTFEIVHASEELARTGLRELAQSWAEDGFSGEDGFSIACMDISTGAREHCVAMEAIEPTPANVVADYSSEFPDVVDVESQAIFAPGIEAGGRRTVPHGTLAPCDQCGVAPTEPWTPTCRACGHELRAMSPQELICHLLASDTELALAAWRALAWRSALADIEALPVGAADRQASLVAAADRLRAWELAAEGAAFPGAPPASTPASGPAPLTAQDAAGALEQLPDDISPGSGDLVPLSRRAATREPGSDLGTIPQAILAVLFVAWLIYVMS